MADTKISALTQLSAQPDQADELVVVDKSDTTMAASGTDKRVQYGDLVPALGSSWPAGLPPTPVSGPASVAAGANNTYYVIPVALPARASITGIVYRVGSAANGSAKVALYNAAGTTRIAYRNNGATQSTPGTNSIHRVAFDTGSAANLDPGLYQATLWFGNTAATFFGGRLLGVAATTTDASYPPTSVTIGVAVLNSDVPFMATY